MQCVPCKFTVMVRAKGSEHPVFLFLLYTHTHTLSYKELQVKKHIN